MPEPPVRLHGLAGLHEPCHGIPQNHFHVAARQFGKLRLGPPQPIDLCLGEPLRQPEPVRENLPHLVVGQLPVLQCLHNLGHVPAGPLRPRHVKHPLGLLHPHPRLLGDAIRERPPVRLPLGEMLAPGVHYGLHHLPLLRLAPSGHGKADRPRHILLGRHPLLAGLPLLEGVGPFLRPIGHAGLELGLRGGYDTVCLGLVQPGLHQPLLQCDVGV